jgi:hypothetical protein
MKELSSKHLHMQNRAGEARTEETWLLAWRSLTTVAHRSREAESG